MAATLTTAAGAELMRELGFLHVPGKPIGPAPAYLFVALRSRPTLRHFDPERVGFWATVEGRGVRDVLDWWTKVPLATPFSWGSISVVDRLQESNDFVAFGGDLAMALVDNIRVVEFSSDAPILARGGHSQEWEPWADEVAAFFATLRAAAGDVRLEKQLDALTPMARYACFVAAGLARFRASPTLAAWQPVTERLLEREQRRLRTETPADWQAGEQLRLKIA